MKPKQFTIIMILVIILFGGGIVALIVAAKNTAGPAASTAENNVTIVDDKQIIEITAKGGYFPRSTAAQAGMPTQLKIKTNGTYDCSAALTIPKLNYNKFLTANGETTIDIPPQSAGTTINGLCSMGMYSFAVTFN